MPQIQIGSNLWDKYMALVYPVCGTIIPCDHMKHKPITEKVGCTA